MDISVTRRDCSEEGQMKPRVAPIVFLAGVCLFSVACSRPKEEKRDTPSGSSPFAERSSPSPIDPWKVASEWRVPADPVGDAQRFLLHASTYQFTTEWENLNTHQKAHEEGSVVHNEAVRIESMGPHGQNGIITDGKIEFVFFQGRYGREPGDAAATLSDQLKGASLQSLLDESEEHTPFLGPGTVNGVEAEVYALVAHWDRTKRILPPKWSQGGGHLRVWIAKDDHRPLKVERKEEYTDRHKPGVTDATMQVRTYRYDPNVKVTLPGS